MSTPPAPWALIASQTSGLWQHELPAATTIAWSPSLRAGDLREQNHAAILLGISPQAQSERHTAAQFLAELVEEGRSLIIAPGAITLAGHQGDAAPYASALPQTRLLDSPAALYAAAIQRNRHDQVRRLIALDGAACVRYEPATGQLSVAGAGSALVATLRHPTGSDPVTLTVDVLTAGMQQHW